MNNDRIEHFKKKYGEAIIANGLRLRPDDFMDEVEWRDAVDQHYTKIWLEFTYGGLYARRVLDERTRVLVAIAQFLTLNEMEEFERLLPCALTAGATPREVLEVILQSTVYVGYVKAGRGAKVCIRVMKELGRLHEITDTQMPLDGANGPRKLEDERPQWPQAESPEVAALREKFIEKYGWGSMSTRLRLQAHQGYETLQSFDRIDPHYLQLWLDFIYGNMYTRGVLDDRTRLLMMVGICLAANEPVQLENHLRGSLMQGATPREVLEVILNSTAIVGMPTTIMTRRMLEKVMEEDGRGGELDLVS